MTEEEKKEIILTKVFNFYNNDDLFELAEAYSFINEVLRSNKFPTAKYLKWLKN